MFRSAPDKRLRLTIIRATLQLWLDTYGSREYGVGYPRMPTRASWVFCREKY